MVASKNSLVLLSLVLCCSMHCKGQKLPITSNNKHEVGFDITPLLSNTIFKSTGFQPLLYNVMYRHHFNKWQLRGGIGVNYNSGKLYTNDTTAMSRQYKYLAFRVGIERKIDFYRRWQFFYGLDLLTRINSSTAIHKHPGNTIENIDKNERYGFASLLGFRFKLNRRISITTESNFAMYYFNNEDKNINQKNAQYSRVTVSKGFNSLFTPVANINFTYNF